MSSDQLQSSPYLNLTRTASFAHPPSTPASPSRIGHTVTHLVLHTLPSMNIYHIPPLITQCPRQITHTPFLRGNHFLVLVHLHLALPQQLLDGCFDGCFDPGLISRERIGAKGELGVEGGEMGEMCFEVGRHDVGFARGWDVGDQGGRRWVRRLDGRGVSVTALCRLWAGPQNINERVSLPMKCDLAFKVGK